MKVLICDTNAEFIRSLTTAVNADFVVATTTQDAFNNGMVNIAVISDDFSEWEAIARHLSSQGVDCYILTANITNIEIWKKSTFNGCKGVWLKETAATEMSGKIQTSSVKRPLREQLTRQSTPDYSQVNNAQINNVVPERKRNQPFPVHGQQKPTIIPKRELICFFGVNGGVGKTTMAINTGIALAKQGQSTVLVDFDVFSGDVVTRLKVKPTTTMVDWIRGNSDDLSQCLADHHSTGLKILPAPLNHEEGELINPEITGKILSILTRRFDVVIVDTAPLLIAPTLITIEHATRVFILVPPDSATVAKTNTVIRRMDMINFEKDKFSLLVTKMPKKQPLRVNDMTSVLNMKLAGIIPYDEGVQVESNLGTPPVLSRRASKFAKSVTSLCNTIIPSNIAPEKSSLLKFAFWKRSGGAF
ncbi:Septum formation inhibitor-activating ATPase- like protein [Desulfofarcimen acetoxidans DSM 771]|uniref:Septum formation inhibitor-activating ATPase-like protein n=1 Tax=Desulfofarcimen acetoxidans (strain ATCC 49208 / DSM 771 / KCTC 5769 / VKM B-1644 / 5575) TaxID=485916 RepID=C8W0P1_DESAS|nr:AAA family ATPase [Desulfofarcimen acetoxidans]ACV63296.1 Septum formation inhibitor-activating ATPase- like protein [Desulfofarcimen acetoxidans DSM 771]